MMKKSNVFTMAHFIRRYAFFVLVILFCNVAWAQTFEIGEIQYSVISDNEVEITKCTNNNKAEICVPSSVSYGEKQYTVTAIGKRSFSSAYLKVVQLPPTITQIKELAFGYCSYLEIINFPNNLQKIDKEAFYNCYKLKVINLPTSLKYIGEHSFEKCGINVLKLPQGLEMLGFGAFYGCSDLTAISFPSSLTRIGNCCFSSCDNIQKVEGLHKDIDWEGGRPLYDAIGKYISKNQNSFSYLYSHNIYKAIEQWQQKRPFETSDQWAMRVTSAKRKQALQSIINQFREEYVQAMGAKAQLNYSLGSYDNEYNIYAISCGEYGVGYVSVPQQKYNSFKEAFNRSRIVPTYCIKDDKLSIASLTVTIDNNTYKTPEMVKVDNDQFALELPPLEINLKEQQPTMPSQSFAYDKTLDENIPIGNHHATQTFVIAIGNENYMLVPKVQFANNDMNIFAQYCQKTLGIPMQNIRRYKDATFGSMLSALNDIKDIADAYNGDMNVIFYYAGHGIPNEKDQTAYLLPTDADGKSTEVCFPLARLYKELGELNAKSVIVFMDACFSGAQRGNGMLASARGVAIKAKEQKPMGKLVVLTAASGEETAYPFKEKGHGLFTYFLLKKLNETKGECSLGELSEYITTNVKRQSIVINRKPQTPAIIFSDSVKDEWMNYKLTK